MQMLSKDSKYKEKEKIGDEIRYEWPRNLFW